jgi:hypothetical protein
MTAVIGMAELNLETKQTFEELVQIARPYVRKLGHTIGEWELGPRPHISFHIFTICKACKKKIKCQKCLVVGTEDEITYRWEIIVGNYISVSLSREAELVENIKDTWERCLCTRLSVML